MPLTPEQRRKNVAKVLEANRRLAQVENALADWAAKVPALLREVQTLRAAIDDALASAAPEVEKASGEEPAGEPEAEPVEEKPRRRTRSRKAET